MGPIQQRDASGESRRAPFRLGMLARQTLLRPAGVEAVERSRTEPSDAGVAVAGSLDDLATRCDHSWLQELSPDPDTEAHAPNKTSREVLSGHYVLVRPEPLPNPFLVTASPAMAAELGLTPEACQTEQFAKFFGGDIDAVAGFKSWATPYALSIYGQEMVQNCPFGTGNGYGDGRAISVGEVTSPAGKRWELQLKGGGTTPFCRGADGRAVLRSSVREFLASEAMHHLNVSTTRALSLVSSKGGSVQRPWYAADGKQRPTKEQLLPQLAHVEEGDQKTQMLMQLANDYRQPDKMNQEPIAITCRVAASFIRVGHLELFFRRVRQSQSRSGPEYKELEELVRHALRREYADAVDANAPLQDQVLAMLKDCRQRFATLAADWIRVGFCQGNFNSDNCLVGGRTMDYGPFGFIEKYDPAWNMWIDGGVHYSFMNAPNAVMRNFLSLAQAMVPLLDGAGIEEIQKIVSEFPKVAQDTLEDVWRRKLGLAKFGEEDRQMFAELELLLRETGVDWTIFWRQLAEVAAADQKGGGALDVLRPAFYAPPQETAQWEAWLGKWAGRLAAEGRDPKEVAAGMKQTSPKYVPREWMLNDAYTAAEQGNFALVEELLQVFSKPFDEQPEVEAKFYRRAADASFGKGGVAFMT